MADAPNQENETPMDSPSNQQTPDNQDANEVTSSPPQLSEEEEAWNNLSGKSQERFSEAIKHRKEAEDRVRELQAQLDLVKTSQFSQPSQSQTSTDKVEVQRAINTLRENGIPTFEDVKSYVDQSYANLWEKNEHERLANKYSGKDYPSYSSDEVADYARRKGFGGNFEAAYRDMYFEEMVDVERNRAKTQRTPTTTKPTSSPTNREEPMDAQSLREKLSGPDGRKWYEEQMRKNPQEFSQMIAQLSQG